MSDPKKVSAKATVVVTLEIDVADRWGSDCAISQAHQQAAASAVGYLRHALDKRVRVVGEPTVKVVTFTRSEDE